MPATVVALLALHAGLLLAALRTTYITVDEIGHVAAGISYWRTGDFRVYRVNPPLSKMLAVLPALAADPSLELGDLTDWPGTRHEQKIGPEFASANREHLFNLVCLSRLMGVAWSVAGGWLVFHWSRTLGGNAAGLLTLVLWCVEPSFLGHAALVTADVPATVAGLYATYAFWRWLKTPSAGRACLAGGLLGLAILVKFTLLIFFVLWPALWLYDRWQRGARSGALGHLVLIVAIGLYILNMGYAFQGSLRPLGSYEFVSRCLAGERSPGNQFRGGVIGMVPVPLPADAVRGIDEQRRDFEAGWRSYLAGEWRNEGWWYYYFYGLAVKLPVGTLALVALGLASAMWRIGRTGAIDDVMLIGTAVALIGLVSSQTGFSHHVRYVFPVLPYLFVCAGRLASHRPGAMRWARALVAAMAMFAAFSSLSVFPHSLSYFNEFAGGPGNGHAYLLDSNIDWGQDLLYLKHWIRAHPEAGRMGVAYFNVVDPGFAGIDCELPPPGPPSQPRIGTVDWNAFGPRPGYYAISVNYLRGFRFFIQDSGGVRRNVKASDLDYFNRFRPIARAGYSIYIYRITAEEADAARDAMGMPRLSSGEAVIESQ